MVNKNPETRRESRADGESESNSQPVGHSEAPNSDAQEDIETLLAHASRGSLNSDEQQRVARLLNVTISREQQFSGPYPPPKLLEQYPQAVQDEICWLTRSYHVHQKDTDWFDRKTAAKERRRGQHYGLAIALSGLLATTIIAFVSPATAAIVGALDLISLTAVFAYPRYLESKQKPNQNAGEDG